MSETLRTRHGYLGYKAADEFDLEEFEDQGIKCAIVIEEMKIKSDRRSKGHGTRLLNKFIEMHATSYIVLNAYPYEELKNKPLQDQAFEEGRKRLIKHYSRFGFVHVGGGWMYRPPTIPLETIV